ncbi:MAG: DEAD/DEAH box helicase [Bryobacteraceae bacterium]
MNTFQELSLSPVLQTNLAQNKLVQPTPVQAQSIPAQLEGRDVVVTAQTGTGKTLAFVLPLLEKLIQNRTPGVNALILSPTRELASQIDETFRRLARGTEIRSAVVTGGANEQRQLLQIRQGAQVVIATPGRLADYLKRKLVKLAPTRFLILDEADRMLDMGFLPTIKEILAMLPAERQTMFFSATMEPSAAQLIRSYLKNPVRVEVGSTTKTADHVDLHLYEIDQDRKLSLLQMMLKDEEGSFLVFARTKHGADRLAQKLINNGANATRIHGNRTQSQRNQALRGFQDGDYRVLVATDVAARGIHVDGIAHVVNYDLPQAPEDFIHRVGRTGRAGVRGTATTFSTKGERSEIGRIERLLGMKLTRRTTAADLPRETRSESHAAPQRFEKASNGKPSYGKPAHHADAPAAKRVPFWQKPAAAARFNNKRKTSSKSR